MTRDYNRHLERFKQKRKERGLSLLRSPTLGRLPRPIGYQGNGVYDRIDEIIDDEAAEQEALAGELCDMIRAKCRFEDMLSVLPDGDYFRILTMIYEDGAKYEQIAAELNLSYDWVSQKAINGRQALQVVLDALEAGTVTEAALADPWQMLDIKYLLFPEHFQDDG